MRIVVAISGKIVVDEPSIGGKILSRCKVISLIHKGSYYNIDKAYSQICKYAEENDLELVLPDRELYLNSPEEVPEEELMTEIQFSIRDKKV